MPAQLHGRALLLTTAERGVAPAGSLEGYIYTTVPVLDQMRGYLEIVTQALLPSALLCYWVRHPGKRWLSWALSIIFAIAVALPILGMLAQRR